MSHSPLHQRLHLRLAMRQSFSSPTLSPGPPYSGGSPAKELRELPATAPPSPELAALETTVFIPGKDNMRATRIRPRTAPVSPERPGIAYSTRSTIRQVDPSPESLSDAFANGFADGGTPAPGPAFEPFPPFNPSKSGDTAVEEGLHIHIPSTEPTAAAAEGKGAGALRRGGTPSGRSSPRKARSCSPQKSRSASPHKYKVHTPTLSAHPESPSSTYSAAESEKWEAPDTPSPIPREQKKQAYAPLQVRRLFADSNSADEPVVGHGTQARIADYMRKMKTQQRGGMARATEEVRAKIEVPPPVKRVVAPASHIVQAMAQPDSAPQSSPSFPVAQEQVQKDKEPVRHTSLSKRSETSGASVASKHSVFSTPGRDEMERKKPIVEEDEGPFANATNMQDLEHRRRTVSEGTRGSDEKDGKKMFCGVKCAVM